MFLFTNFFLINSLLTYCLPNLFSIPIKVVDSLNIITNSAIIGSSSYLFLNDLISMYCLTFKLIHLDNCQYNIDSYNIVINLINVFSGQLLNFHVYKQLGIKGVCYGVFFGENIPWVTEFPFNIKYTDHPQYLGSWLTYIAILDLYKNNITCSDNYELYHRISNLQILITILYFLSAKFETYKYRQLIKKQ